MGKTRRRMRTYDHVPADFVPTVPLFDSRTIPAKWQVQQRKIILSGVSNEVRNKEILKNTASTVHIEQTKKVKMWRIS